MNSRSASSTMIDRNGKADHGGTSRRPPIARAHLLFWLTMASCLAIIVGLGQMAAVDAFTEDQQRRRIILSELPARDVVEAKVNHARQVQAYDFAVFGNSRVLMLSNGYFTTPDRRYFNFGIGGITFLTSINLAERLSAIGKLPGTVFISFDNPEIPFMQRAPDEFNPIRRIARELEYSLYVLQNEPDGSEQGLVFLRDCLEREWTTFKETFSFERLRRVMAFRWPSLFYGSKFEDGVYLADGSRREPGHADEPLSWEPVLPTPEVQTTAPAVELGLQKLAALQREGHRIIVYESPIHPDWTAYVAAHPNPPAAYLRQAWRQACDRLELTCLDAPVLSDHANRIFWFDSNHAPAPLLAAWLEQQLKALPTRHGGKSDGA